MTEAPQFACIGGAHVDAIGRAAGAISAGWSHPGAARFSAGGVALNLACGLARLGARAALVGAVGRDGRANTIGRALIRAGVENLLIPGPTPTGSYIAVEDGDGELLAAVADLEALERCAPDALAAAPPRDARIVVDANLTTAQLEAIAARPGPLSAVAVSPPKAPRLSAVLPRLDALILNKAEAETLTRRMPSAEAAAAELAALTPAVVFVTDGARPAAVAYGDRLATRAPEPLKNISLTGAGDAFAAGALMALAKGATAPKALEAGHDAAHERLTEPK